MSLDNLLKDGGKILVIGGMFSKQWESFRAYPQIDFWSGEQKEIKRLVHDKDFPPNTRAVIFSRFISHAELDPLMVEVRKRNITFFSNKNDGEITNILEQIVNPLGKPSVVEVPKDNSRGRLTKLIPFIDWTKNSRENADVLVVKAKELQIPTTHKSLCQFVMKQRRGKRVTAIPGSIQKMSHKLDVSVDMLDAMVRDISGMRDFLIEITEENRMLKGKVDKYKKAIQLIDE
jgi:hypothetical protein